MVAFLLLTAALQDRGAVAQPCGVTALDAVQLDDAGSAVYLAINHLTGDPAVVWVADDDLVYLSRYTGAGWSATELVDTGGIIPVTSEIDTHHCLPGMALAIDSYGTYHLIIGDGSFLHHFENDGTGWSAGQIIVDTVAPNPADPHLIVRADFDANDVLHVVYAIDGGNETSGKGLRYVQLDSAGWSLPYYVASGPFMHMSLGYDGSVHVTYLQFHGMVGTWRNYQGHYRQRAPDGTWTPDEQATDEAPVGTLGPVAIHPAVAAGPDGEVHMIYPMDPPDPGTAPSEAGHASIITRTSGGWTTPLEIFPNAIHAAFVEIAVDPAGVVYAFGINWQKRYRVDLGAGFEPVGFWDSASSRWFSRSVAAGPAGGWIAYAASRRIGPIKVVQLSRTGGCGAFCGDGLCGAGEDGCSCLYDCTDQCCIDGSAYALDDPNPADPCDVCRPQLDRRHFTRDPSAPGCTPSPDAGLDAGSTTDPDASDASDASAATPDASPADPDPGIRSGCSCVTDGTDDRSTPLLPLVLVAIALLAGLVRTRRGRFSSLD
jgi:MYXO-CTERM domain-containing protein